MSESVFLYGKWICPKEFAAEEPVDVFHKQLDPREIELPEAFKNLHMLVRKTFCVEGPAEQPCRIRITADDYYKLYINGKFVCQGPSQGYYFCYYWNEVDITEYLQPGENEIFVDVYYQGLINRAYNSGDRRMGLLAEVLQGGFRSQLQSGLSGELRSSSSDQQQGELPGVRCLAATDDTWEYTMSGAYSITHTIGYDTMFAENFDSRWQPERWERCCVKAHDYTFSRESAKVLKVYEKEPVTVTPLENGGWLYDFGEEITASLKITARGERGSRVRILCGEELEDSPVKVRYQMRCSCLCEEFWTLDGPAVESNPENDRLQELQQYDYRAFRYAAVLPETQQDTEILSVTAMVRHYPFDDDYCTLETKDSVLQSVWQICKNGIKYGSQEVYVDCPMREKGQYAGDLTISSASQIILTGDLSLFKKALDNQIQSAFICKGLMAVTPGSLMQEIADYSLQFPILALRCYAYTGDREYLKKCLEVCDGILEHFGQYAGADGLLEDVVDKWNLVDWPVNLRDDYDFPLKSVVDKGSGAHNVLNAFYIGCVKQTEEISEILGIPRVNKSAALCEAFHRAFFRPETGLYADSRHSNHSSLHSNAVAAFYGIHRPEEEQAIRDLIMEKGFCCGVYMAYFVLKALCRMGRYEDAYKLIVAENEHSWYNMVREGATTCFEAWGKDQKWNTSLCHPWASAPISVLAEDVLPHMPEVGRLIFKTGVQD